MMPRVGNTPGVQRSEVRSPGRSSSGVGTLISRSGASASPDGAEGSSFGTVMAEMVSGSSSKSIPRRGVDVATGRKADVSDGEGQGTGKAAAHKKQEGPVAQAEAENSAAGQQTGRKPTGGMTVNGKDASEPEGGSAVHAVSLPVAARSGGKTLAEEGDNAAKTGAESQRTRAQIEAAAVGQGAEVFGEAAIGNAGLSAGGATAAIAAKGKDTATTKMGETKNTDQAGLKKAQHEGVAVLPGLMAGIPVSQVAPVLPGQAAQAGHAGAGKQADRALGSAVSGGAEQGASAKVLGKVAHPVALKMLKTQPLTAGGGELPRRAAKGAGETRKTVGPYSAKGRAGQGADGARGTQADDGELAAGLKVSAGAAQTGVSWKASQSANRSSESRLGNSANQPSGNQGFVATLLQAGHPGATPAAMHPGASVAANGAAAANPYARMDEPQQAALVYALPQKMSVKVSDPALGSFEVRARSAGAQVSASLATASAVTHAQLSGQLPALTNFLQEQQVNLARVSVVQQQPSLLGGDSTARGFGGQQRQGRARSQARGAPGGRVGAVGSASGGKTSGVISETGAAGGKVPATVSGLGGRPSTPGNGESGVDLLA